MRTLFLLPLLILFHVCQSQQHDVNNRFVRPALLSPQNNSFIKYDPQSINFSWTAVSPMPDVQVNYFLKVYKIEPGQSSADALANAPVFEKQTNTTHYTWMPLMSSSTGMQQGYLWTVQATDNKLRGFGDNNGISLPNVFVAGQYIIQIDDMVVTCTATPGIYNLMYKLTNPNLNPAKLITFTATGSVPAGATITIFSPPLNTIIPSGNSLIIMGTITGPVGLTNMCVGAEIQDQVILFNKASKDTCVKVKPCICLDCNQIKFNIIPAQNYTIANNILTINQPISIISSPVKLVKKITADLVYFEFTPEYDDCLLCNKNSNLYGNFDSASLANVSTSGNGSHSISFNYLPPHNFSTPSNAIINITLPPLIKCCDAQIRWCIRYIITFEDCKVCEVLVCYEQKDNACSKLNSIPENLRNNLP